MKRIAFLLLFISPLCFAWQPIYQADDKKVAANFNDLSVNMVDRNSMEPKKVATLPTTGIREGVIFYNTTDHRMYYSTETVKDLNSYKQF